MRTSSVKQPAPRKKRNAGLTTLQKIAIALGALLVLGGVCGVLYPIIGRWINANQYRAVVDEYMGQANELSRKEAREMLLAAEEYNQRLQKCGTRIGRLTAEQYEEYDQMLRVDGTEVMGTLEIPKINVLLPIYHGTSDSVLQAGVGHLEGSSLPVGGSGVHTVLTGHSGLPSKMLFTDLDQLEAGDVFTITVLGRVNTYVVTGTEVVLPSDIVLHIADGEDQCTLITCTPIGVNTERLLVYGRAVDTKEEVVGTSPEAEEVPADAVRIPGWLVDGIVLACGALVLGTVAVIRRSAKKKRGDEPAAKNP